MKKQNKTPNPPPEEIALQEIFAMSAEYPLTTHADPSEILERKEESEIIQQMLERLPDQQQRVIKDLYGFDGPPLTVYEIAEDLGITHQAVRALHERGQIALVRENPLPTLKLEKSFGKNVREGLAGQVVRKADPLIHYHDVLGFPPQNF